ncbi:MAG: shikimate dehydrogenase [Flavobacteriales bacterium]|nr:shikimate dehydrogenase [Flavobacteriales bacterium]
MVRYGLIGEHLGHSFSQRYFTEKFAREGSTDHRYDLFELKDLDELAPLLADTPDLVGLNVTIPYKQAILPMLNELDPVAAAVGAVNTIRIRNGAMTGHNTDVEGFKAMLLPMIADARPRALVLGSGGASRAVVYVLRELGLKFRVVSRSRGTGDLTWDLLDPALVGACPLIINTTPIGMHPKVDDMPEVPMSAIGPRHILLDLIYNPERTRFLQEGAARGARISNGLAMLHAQAEAAWRIWNGITPFHTPAPPSR